MPYFEIIYFNLGPVKIYTWGLFVGLAFTAGYFWLLWQGQKKGLLAGKIIGLAVAVFLGAIIGSRVLYLFQTPGRLLGDISLFWQFNLGGSMFYGGFLGALLAGWLYAKKLKLNFWEIADLSAPALALGIGIGRIGCALVSDHQGVPTNLPWGILWPDGIARHPVALYESLLGFLLFFTFLYLQKRINKLSWRGPRICGGRSNPILQQPFADSGNQRDRRTIALQGFAMTGILFLVFIVSYSFFRFFLDFLRELQGVLVDPRWLLGLTSSQWISVLLFILSAGLIYEKMLKLNK